MSDAGSAAKPDDEPGPRARRFANGVLIVAAAVCVFEVFLAFTLHRSLAVRAFFPALTLLLLGALRIKPAYRLSLALTVLPTFPGACAVMYARESKRVPDGTAVTRHGGTFDSRSRWEVVDDLRRQGKEAVPSIGVHQFLAGDNLGPHIPRPEAMLPVIDGQVTVPLAGVSGVTTVLCNEGGQYAVYEADEHGFRNPTGLWGLPDIEVAIVGDSFAGGDCVPMEQSAAGFVRARHPATLNLGVGGNGPLAELAGITEFLPRRRPRVVLWMYYMNDLSDLEHERQNAVLRRYLEPSFRQELEQKQPQIDAALRKVFAAIDRRAKRYPAWPARVGLDRRSAPLWFTDLVMNEHHSITSAVMRLDALDSGGAPAVLDHPQGDFHAFEEILGKAKALVSSWGGTLYFVYVPDLYLLIRENRAQASPNRAPVLAAARSAGVPVIDVQPAVLAAPDLSALSPHPTAHFGEAGYRLMADTILAAIEHR